MIQIGVVSDGKYGNRAYENISTNFNVDWILVPDIPLSVMLDDPIDMDIPKCDLYISYVRHPDVILQLAELGKPLILGVLPGTGLYEQARDINSNTIHARTMCSLENDTGIEEIDIFAGIFGRPTYEVELDESLNVVSVEVKRTSLCGSSEAGARFIKNKKINEDNLRDFALSVCHECRAPRFGRTCDKEIAGIIHLLSLFEGIPLKNKNQFSEELIKFFQDIREDYLNRIGAK